MANSTSNHFTCPNGGSWYVCPDAPHFVGCCASDPCKNVAADSTSPCPTGSLYAASYDTSLYEKIVPNTCIESNNTDWYSCTVPAFVGCCEIDACKNSGCPKELLLQAAWSDSKPGQFALFNDEGTDKDDAKGSGLSGGAIAGIVVGAVAALVIVGALIWFFMRRRRNRKTVETTGNGKSPSAAQGEHQRMYSSPAPPYQNSQFSSPAGTTFEAGNDPKYMPTSPGAISPPSLSPGLTSESGRPISELYSNSTRSEELSQQKWASGQSYGLGVHGAQKPEPIQELDSNMAEVHELDGGFGRYRP